MDAPVVAIWHSGGARLAEGVESLDGVGRVFAAMVEASGQVLQLSLVLGAAAGGAAYGSALTDILHRPNGAPVRAAVRPPGRRPGGGRARRDQPDHDQSFALRRISTSCAGTVTVLTGC
jgi:Carboxyl transferase domain